MANAETVEDVFSDVLSDEQKKEAADQDVTQEDKPAPSGYMSKDDWEASGKDPKDWVTGSEEMTDAQRSYLKTLSDEAGETVDENLSKASASEKIEDLQQKTGRGLNNDKATD